MIKLCIDYRKEYVKVVMGYNCKFIMKTLACIVFKLPVE